jgi:hypothetical protein
MASAVALVVYALPLYMQDPSKRLSQAQLTSDYIRSMRLLQNSSRGVGDLILVYKRVTNLASHTSRVAELLEQVSTMCLDAGCGVVPCHALAVVVLGIGTCADSEDVKA